MLCMTKCATLQTGAFFVKRALQQPAKTSPTPPPQPAKRRSRPLQNEYDRFLHEKVGLVVLISVVGEEKKKRVRSTVITPPCALLHAEIGLAGAPGRPRAIPYTPIRARGAEYEMQGLRSAELWRGAREIVVGGLVGQRGGRKRGPFDGAQHGASVYWLPVPGAGQSGPARSYFVLRQKNAL